MAPAGSALMTCSVAHRRSAGVAASIQTTWSAESPSWQSPPTWGSFGGAIKYRRPFSLVNAGMAGPSSRHSQTAACAVSSSVKLRVGQPPPGNSASSAAKPVGTVMESRPPSSVPRQSASATCAGRGFGSGAHDRSPAACLSSSDSSSEQKIRADAGGKAITKYCMKQQYMCHMLAPAQAISSASKALLGASRV